MFGGGAPAPPVFIPAVSAKKIGAEGADFLKKRFRRGQKSRRRRDFWEFLGGYGEGA